MERELFREEHDVFRDSFRRFIAREVRPNQERWRAQGFVDREAWRKAGEGGWLCPWLGAEHGGPGGDFLCSVIINEELAAANETGFALPLHSDIYVPYLSAFGTDEQKRAWLPGCASGDLVTALALTEPGAGSDLSAIATTAVRDGGDYIINGHKTFISNGTLCDLCIVAARTDRAPTSAHRGISLFVVEASRPGFHKGKRLAKLGMPSQDTAELVFADCRVPAKNRLGDEGDGFRLMMQKLPQERLVVAIGAQSAAEQVLKDTIAYAKERSAFGRPLSKLQNTQFKLAECATQIEVGRVFIDRLITKHVAGAHLLKECSMAKLWQTEMLGEVVDTCLQLFGGYGYMLEYPVARAYADARAQRIFAGTSEIMKIIIAGEIDL